MNKCASTVFYKMMPMYILKYIYGHAYHCYPNDSKDNHIYGTVFCQIFKGSLLSLCFLLNNLFVISKIKK